MSKLWLLLWCCECEKSCRLTAVGVMCCAACVVLGIQYVVLRHIPYLVLGDQWNSLQLPLDASIFGFCSTI